MKVNKSPLVMISTGQAHALRIRRMIKLSLIVIVLGCVVLAYLKLTQPGSFPITTVKIEGNYPHINERLFQQKLTPYATGGFFEVDVEALKQQALTFPWVYQVDVRKIFPSTVMVIITEQTPVAQWNNDALLNAKGDLFQPPIITFPAKLPVLYGPDGQASMMLASFDRMNQILNPLNLHIIRMDLSLRRSWQIQLDNHLVVILGRTLVWQKLQRLVNIYPQIFGKTERKAISVDLRYPNGLAIHWK